MPSLKYAALLTLMVAAPVFAAPQAHGGHAPTDHGNMSTDKDIHGDTVSAMTKTAKAGDEKVGPAVSDVAQDKAKGKGLTKTKTHGHGH